MTITPVDLQKNLESVKGSFNKNGKLTLKWVRVEIGGKTKKLGSLCAMKYFS